MKDKGIFANQLKSIVGTGNDGEIGEPVFSLVSIDDRIEISPKLRPHWKKKRKMNRGKIRIRIERRDLGKVVARKFDDFIKRMKERREAGVPIRVVVGDTVSISRPVRYRSLNGNKASSARAHKRLIDFCIKKLVHVNTTMGGKQAKQPTGNRRQKYQDYVKNVEQSKELIRKAAETISETIHNLPAGSYSRGVPTELGGYLTKTTGPMSTGGRIMTEEEAAMDERMRYAEATGQYDPWDKEVDE